MQATVGMAGYRVSSSESDVLVTYSLGSCIGLCLYDPVARVGGMLHCMLPSSNIEPERAGANPCMFTDTGVPFLIGKLAEQGADTGQLTAKAAGAASLLNVAGGLTIGERNKMALERALLQQNIRVAAFDMGGTAARSMCLYIADGRVAIKSRGREYEL